MKSVKNELAGFSLVPFVRGGFQLFSLRKGIGMLTIMIATTGCVKKDLSQDRDYGYGKLTVECEKKCSVSFGTPDKMNIYDIDGSMAIYYIRYQAKYNLDINVTPIDEDQRVILNVYSREEKQIFHNEAIREANELWYSKIIIP